MTKPTTNGVIVLIMMGALFLTSPSRVDAQTASGPEFYFNASFGAQPQRHTVEAIATSTIFDEAATVTAEHRIGNGAFFDIAAGQRMFLPNLIIGLAFSSFSSNGTAAGTASIPDPLFRNRPAIVGVEMSDLNRSEQFFHLQAVWFRPVTEKIDLAVAVGPSLARVSQQFASVALRTGTTQTIDVAPGEQSGSGFGFNGGVDLTYLVTPQYGVGMLLRYTWAKVGLDAADVTAGGFQAGLGLRVRF